MMKQLSSLIILCICLTGCDMPGRLVIVNKSDYDVIVNLDSFPTGALHQSFDMSAIHLTKENPKITFIYGFGGHPPQRLAQLHESFKEVKYIDKGDTTIINDPETLQAMLPKRITGLFNTGLKMKIR